jgi:hypothetical protein
MSERASAVERTDDGLNYAHACGWRGPPDAVDAWAVERGRDRLVRRCPGCDEPVPEWGTFRGLEGAALVARGDVAEALERAGVPVPDRG